MPEPRYYKLNTMKFTFILAATLFQFATSTLTAVGQDSVGGDSISDEYVVNIAKIQNDLDAGRIDAATKSLDSTPAALRDFEYEYKEKGTFYF